ncbi:MAG: filamentous hemagglutinin N-terminal domain-containing protein [Cyanobacteria bacterium P01_A01_bin.83]
MKESWSLLLSVSCCALSNSIVSTPALAQVSADGTTNTTINGDGNGNFTIDQGDRAGNNLFHSFGDFSVPNNGSAFFDNATDVSNIFSRVTGGNISQYIRQQCYW